MADRQPTGVPGREVGGQPLKSLLAVLRAAPAFLLEFHHVPSDRPVGRGHCGVDRTGRFNRAAGCAEHHLVGGALARRGHPLLGGSDAPPASSSPGVGSIGPVIACTSIEQCCDLVAAYRGKRPAFWVGSCDSGSSPQSSPRTARSSRGGLRARGARLVVEGCGRRERRAPWPPVNLGSPDCGSGLVMSQPKFCSWISWTLPPYALLLPVATRVSSARATRSWAGTSERAGRAARRGSRGE